MSVYIVCKACQRGKYVPDNQDEYPKTFVSAHTAHEALELVVEATFLEDYLAVGYIDVDRPGAKPIKTHFIGAKRPPVRVTPFGMPGTEKTNGVNDLRRGLMAAPQKSSSRPVSPISLRPSWDDTFLDVARVLSRRGTCARKQVGAVLVKDNRIISTGYNGAPVGIPHCTHQHVPKGQKDPDMEGGHCARAEHAERNAIIFAGREARGGSMYVTCSPCLPCARMMVTAGVTRIIYSESYRCDRRVEELCVQAGIELRHQQVANLVPDPDFLPLTSDPIFDPTEAIK